MKQMWVVRMQKIYVIKEYILIITANIDIIVTLIFGRKSLNKLCGLSKSWFSKYSTARVYISHYIILK